MAEKIGDLYAQLDANMSGWVSGMESAGLSVARLEKESKASFVAISRAAASFSALAGGAAVAGTAALINSWAQGAEETARFADRIGVATEELSRLQFVAQSSGVPIDTLNDSLQEQVLRLNEAAQGNKTYQEAIQGLGLDVQDLVALSPDEAFLRIAGAMEELETQGQRVVAAEQVWGEEGLQLLQITNQGTEAIEAMSAEAEALGAILTDDAADSATDFNRAINEMMASLKGLGNAVLPVVIPLFTEFIDLLTLLVRAAAIAGRSLYGWIVDPLLELNRLALEGISGLIGLFSNDAQAAFDRLAGLTEAARDVEKELRDLNKTSTETGRVFGTIGDSAKTTKDEIDKFIDSLEKQEKVFEQNAVKIEALVIWFDELSPEDQIRQMDFFNETLEKLGGIAEQTTSELDEFRASLTAQEQELESNREKIEILAAWFKELPFEEQAEHAEFFIETLKRLGAESRTTFDAAKQEADEWAKLMERSVERLDDAFAAFWEQFLGDGKNAFDAFKDLAIKTLAEIIHAYTTRKIVAVFDTTGAGPGGGQGAGGAAGGILGTIADVLGSFVGLGVATAVGGLLGGLFGGGSRVKETQLFAGNVGAPIGGFNVGAESPFGSMVQFGMHRIGGEGQLSNEQANEIMETLQNVSEIIVGIDEIIAGTLDAAMMADIDQVLRDLPAGSRNYAPEVVDQFIRERFTAIFGAVDEALGEVFSETSAGLESDALLEYTHQVALLNEAMSEGNQVFTDVASTAETLNVLMNDFAMSGESLAGVLERLSQANAALGQLGLSGETQEGARFNLSVLEAFGNDAQRLNQLVTEFFDAFFSETENLERQIGQLGGLVPDMLAELGTSRESFSSDFMRMLQEGLLSPEDVRAWLEAGEALSALISLEEELAAIRQRANDTQIAAINEQIAAIQGQIDIQRQLQAQIESISESLDQSFGQSIQDIRLALMDSEGQYNFFRDTIEELAGSIDDISDPEELRRVLEQINQMSNQAFGLLGEGQQQAVGEEMIAFLEDALARGQERLTEIAEESAMAQAELERQQAEREEEIQQINAEAAATQFAAAQTMETAATRFAQAQSIPLAVQVTVTSEMVGA